MIKKKFLFVHQNFPGQFVHISAELARLGHDVVALTVEDRPRVPGVHTLRYRVSTPAHFTSVVLARDFETKVVRAASCAAAMRELKAQGFMPDVVVAHPAWGESMFCKDIWPATRYVVFSEFFFNPVGTDYAFDAEFSLDSAEGRSALRLKNTSLLHALHAADSIYTPTEWQRAQIPAEYRRAAHVIFDGIDTDRARPDRSAVLRLPRFGLQLTADDEVITFVNRNLEPYRGFHVFMRALPAVLQARPRAHVVVIGRDGTSYGRKRADGRPWREVLVEELGEALPLERVHFVGGVPYADYLSALRVSGCHVYLTYPFVLSWSCLEAMSIGCTVIGSDTAPVREVIADGENGLLVDFFDSGQLATSIIAVLAGPPMSKMQARARETIVRNYDLRTKCLPALEHLLLQPA